MQPNHWDFGLEKKNSFRIVKIMNNFCIFNNLPELLKKIYLMIVDNFFLCLFAFFSALSILAKVRLEPVVHTRSRTLAHSTGVLKSFYFHDFSLRAAWNGYQLLKQFWGRNHGKINNSKYARYGPLIWVWTSKFNKISKKLPKLIKHVMWVFEYMSVNWYAIFC